jgi:sec-independent protein translocase protein TatA
MLSGVFGLPHLLILLAIIVLIFGSTKLPALARALSQSRRIVKSEMDADKAEKAASATSATPADQPTAADLAAQQAAADAAAQQVAQQQAAARQAAAQQAAAQQSSTPPKQ